MKNNKPATQTPPGWSKPARIVCSLIVVVHLLAVFAAPFSGPPPASMFARGLGDLFQPYLRGMYLYHGYRFFAPDPGPSHLVRYEVDTKTDGTIEGTFPDLEQQWPRLLYHRYFMLSETLYGLESARLPPEIFAEQQALLQREIDRVRREGHFKLAVRFEREKAVSAAQYQRLERQIRLLKQAIAGEIARAYDADQVRLYLVEHTIPLQRDIEETLLDRRGTQRDTPILLIDQSRYSERQIYPESAAGSPLEEIDPPLTDRLHDSASVDYMKRLVE